MVYSLEFVSSVDDKFQKLKKRNKVAFTAIGRKLKRVADDPYRFKPLKTPLQGKWRVHIDSSFVLIYEINETKKTVVILDYAHHDEIYR